MSDQAPLMPPSDQDLDYAQQRLAAAKDGYEVAAARAQEALQDRKDAQAELTSALDAWRELRRQAVAAGLFTDVLAGLALDPAARPATEATDEADDG